MHIQSSTKLDGKPQQGGGRRPISDSEPLFSVVTVVFNGAQDLEQTVISVSNQTSVNFEYIIVDGGSTDGTLDILRKYDSEIDLWVSEPDNGVYDAFNKACRLLSGTWTIFLGAGDIFHNSGVLASMAKITREAAPETELIYGRVRVVSGNAAPAELVNRPWQLMHNRWEGGRPMFPHHQGIFHHKRLFVSPNPFDVSYRIAADSKLIYPSVQRCPPVFSDTTVATVSLGGLSTDPRYFMTTAKEIYRVNREFGYANWSHQLWFFLKATSKAIIFMLTGDEGAKLCIDSYRKLTGREAKWMI